MYMYFEINDDEINPGLGIARALQGSITVSRPFDDLFFSCIAPASRRRCAARTSCRAQAATPARHAADGISGERLNKRQSPSPKLH